MATKHALRLTGTLQLVVRLQIYGKCMLHEGWKDNAKVQRITEFDANLYS